MCRHEYDLVFYRVLYVTLFAIGLTFTVILTSVFVDIDGILTLRNKDVQNSFPQKSSQFYNHDQSDSDSRSENEENNENFDEPPSDYDDTSESQPSRTKRSTDGQKFRFKNPQAKKILTSHLASLLDQFDDSDASVYRRSEAIVTTTDKSKKDRLQYGILKDELVKQTKEIDDENVFDSRKFLKKNLRSLFLDAVSTDKNGFDDVARQIKANLEAYESLTNGFSSSKPTASVLLDPTRSIGDSSSKIVEDGSSCDSIIDQMMMCLRGRRSKGKSFNAKAPKLLIKTTIDISSLVPKPADNLKYGKDEVMGVVKLVLNGKEIFVESQLEDVLELMRKHGLNIDTDNNVLVLGQPIPLDFRKNNIEYERNTVEDTRRSLEELMRTYLALSHSKREQSYLPIYSVNNQRKRRHKRHVDNLKRDTSNINLFADYEEEALKAIKKRNVLKALVNTIETVLNTDDYEKQKAIKKKTMVVKHWHIKKRMQNPLKSDNNISRSDKTRQFSQDAMVTSSPKASSAIESNEKTDITHYLKKKVSMNSAETGEVDIDYDNIMLYKDIPQRQQRPLYDSVESSRNKKSNMYPLENADGSPSGYTLNFNKNNGKDTGIEDLMMSYFNIYNDLDAFSNFGSEYSFGHGVSKRELKRTAHDESSDEENHIHHSKYTKQNGRVYLPFENYQDIYNSKSRHHRKKTVSHYHSGKFNYIDQLGNFGDLPEEDLLKRKLKPAEILSLANILETPTRKRRSLQTPLTIKYPIRKRIKGRVIHIPMSNRTPKSKTTLLNKKRNPRKKNEDENKKGLSYFWTENFKLSRKKNNTKKIKLNYRTPKIRLKRDVSEYEDEIRDEIETSRSQSGRSLEKLVNYRNEDEADPGSMLSNNEDTHSSQPAFINSIIYSIKSRRNTLLSQYPQIFTPNLLKNDDEEDDVQDSEQSHPEPPRNQPPKQEIGLNQFLNFDFPSLSNLAQAVATSPVERGNKEKPKKKNYKVTVKILPKSGGVNKTNPGFNELHTTINKSYTENGMRYYTVFNVSEISKVEMDKPPPKTAQKAELLDRIKAHQAKVDAFMRKHQAVMDSHLKIFEDDASHLNRALQNIVSNINTEPVKGSTARDPKPTDSTTPTSKVVEPGLSVHNATNIKLLNDDTDKLGTTYIKRPIIDIVNKIDVMRPFRGGQRAYDGLTVKPYESFKETGNLRGSDSFRGTESLRGSDSFRGTESFRGSDSFRGTENFRGSENLKSSGISRPYAHYYYYQTDSPYDLKERINLETPITTTPSLIHDIVHKNVYLTEEILKKIDRNTEMLNTFLNRLMVPQDPIIPKQEPYPIKKFPLFKTSNNTQGELTFFRKINDQGDAIDCIHKVEEQNPKTDNQKTNGAFDMGPNEKHIEEKGFQTPNKMVFAINTIDRRMSSEHHGLARADNKNNNDAYFLDSPFTNNNSQGKTLQRAPIGTPPDGGDMMLNNIDVKKKTVATSKVITLPFKVKLNSTENIIP